MYRYTYVRVEGKVMKEPCFWDYRKVIDQYAAEGWRYVGYIPTAMALDGRVYNVDLIFEQKAEEEQ